jgi:tetratricopeptide (TPR) repeat protein
MLARIEAALPVLRELPEGSRYSRLAATFHEQMGDACMRRGARAGAEQHFGRAVELWLDSSAGAPGDIEPLRRLATTTAKLGDARRERGFLGDAEQLYRTALRIDEELAALHPGNDDILDDLAWSYLRMAGLLSQREEHAGSCELYARALYSMRQAFDRKPEDEDRLFGMGCMHFDMANALHRLSGPADEIEPLYETAMQFATRLAREHADNPDYAGFCTGCLATTGRWFHGRGDLDRAATALDAAIRAARLWIDHAERQGDRGGGVHVQNMRSLVLSAFEELAALELRRGGVAEAKAALGEARSCLEDPAAAGREQAPHEVVMVSLAGDIAMARGEAAAAERLWREAILVSGDNTERGRLLARLAGHGMATTEERGELDRRMHDLERARTPTEGQMLLGLQELLGDSDGMAATRRRLEEAARPVVHRMREILAGSR